MTVAEWAQALDADAACYIELQPREARELAAVLRRAERVEAAARNVLAAADLCDYWYEADIAPLREALEG